MIAIKFPSDAGQRYYSIHIKYIFEMLRRIPGISISLVDIPYDINNVSFTCYIDGKEVIFSFSDDNYKFEDNPASKLDSITDIPIFKFHCGIANTFKSNVIPFAPVSFYDWDQYEKLQSIIRYKADGAISMNQRVYGNAADRRNTIKQLLIQKIPINLDLSIIPQENYWKSIEHKAVSIHVPGYCNNMIDRGQLQLMAFGCCTISPNLPEMLPHFKQFIPDVHYIRCAGDYSDLIEKIDWCKSHTNECVDIGNNAKTLFRTYFTPARIWEWIRNFL